MTAMMMTTQLKARKTAGLVGYLAGQSAEDTVAADYTRKGFDIVARRWRGVAGEIDMIVRDGDGFIFVEIKKSKTLASAASRLSRRQMERICNAALEFAGQQPRSLLTDMRFDLALVDGTGQTQILANAFGEF